jgi:RNA polymerase sigma-70 factor (ECF subfamily)
VHHPLNPINPWLKNLGNLHYSWAAHRGANLPAMSLMSESTPEDRHYAALMQSAQAGHADAYRQLLEEIAPRLRRIVRGRCQFLRTEDIEDLVQDVLLSLHAVRATYDPQRPFMPWLLAITRNRIADGARRYARREAQEVHIEDWAVTFSSINANFTREGYGDVEALKHAIRALPQRQRSAIEMLKLREMSLKEAAAACGMSIGSLKVATHRAMSTLRKTLVKDK